MTESQLCGNQEPINLEEYCNMQNDGSQRTMEKPMTDLQRKFLNSCSDNCEDYQKAKFIECNYFIGSQNGTPYICMRYKLNDKEVYYEDNFYLSDNAYSHNLDRLQQVVYVLGGNLTVEQCYDENTLRNYLNSFKGTNVLIQQFRNRSGHKLYNIAKIQEEV